MLSAKTVQFGHFDFRMPGRPVSLVPSLLFYRIAHVAGVNRLLFPQGFAGVSEVTDRHFVVCLLTPVDGPRRRIRVERVLRRVIELCVHIDPSSHWKWHTNIVRAG
jgi:hypothetical protein